MLVAAKALLLFQMMLLAATKSGPAAHDRPAATSDCDLFSTIELNSKRLPDVFVLIAMPPMLPVEPLLTNTLLATVNTALLLTSRPPPRLFRIVLRASVTDPLVTRIATVRVPA